MKRDKEKTQPIQVFVRIRPLNRQERESRSFSCIEVLNARELLVKQQYGKRYCFDGVFSQSVKQITVYDTIVKPLIAEMFAGYNCTVFAYGQTGTGKTYTMAGGSSSSNDISWQDDEQAGIIPRALAHLFDELRLIQQDYTVRVSYLELYNEELYDLLADGEDANRIRIFDDQRQKGSIIVQGIEEQTVSNKHEVYKILEKGEEKRRTATTLMNDHSSRSHTVFCVTLHTRETTAEGEELVKTGKLNLVDLAGSENISRSGAVDLRAREAGNINQSLLNLGRVIKALVEKSAHVPYRASKLTRLLQDSLGGRTKTSIIATVSPATICLDETSSTLDYANRARYITNRPEVNQRMSQKALMTQYIQEIDRLRKDLSATRTGNGVLLANENYNRLIADKQMCSEELAEKIVTIHDLEEQLKIMQDKEKIYEQQWNQLLCSFHKTNDKLNYYRNKFRNTAIEKEEQEHLASCYSENATTLYKQAQVLLDVTKSASTNEAFLQDKIERLYTSAISNAEIMKKMNSSVEDTCCKMITEFGEFMGHYYNTNDGLIHTIKSLENIQTKTYEINASSTTSAGEQIKDTINDCRTKLENQQEGVKTLLNELTDHCKGYTEIVNVVQNWSSTRLCDYIEQMLKAEKQQHEKFYNRMEKKLTDIVAVISTSSQNITMKLNADNEELIFELEKLVDSLSQQCKCTNDSMTQLNKWHEELHKTVDSGFEAIRGKLEHVKDTENSSLLHANTIGKSIQSIFSTTNDHIKKSVTNTLNTVIDLKTMAEDTKYQTPVILQNKILNNLNTDKRAREKLTMTQLERLSKNLDSFAEDYTNANFEALNQLKCKLDTKLKNLLAGMQKQTETTADLLSQSNSQSGAILKELENCNKFASEFEISLFTKLSNCKENSDNNSITEIKHRGDTPERPQYNFPTILKEPNSKESILLEHRQQKAPKIGSLDGSFDSEISIKVIPPVEFEKHPIEDEANKENSFHEFQVIPKTLQQCITPLSIKDEAAIKCSSNSSGAT